MDPHAPWLAAILAAPDDDRPRLLYADWLDENASTVPCSIHVHGKPAHPQWDHFQGCKVCNGTGQMSNGFAERAEFIRVQCELARMEKPDANCPRGSTGMGNACEMCYPGSDALCSRALELLGGNEGLWLDWLKAAWSAEWVPVRECGVTWHRGFVEHVTCTAADWLAHGDAICAATPLREVTLTSRQPSWLSDEGTTAWLKLYWPQVKTWNLRPTNYAERDFAQLFDADPILQR